MKKITVPLIDVRIEIYVGEEEWDKFRKIVLKNVIGEEFRKEVLSAECPESDVEGRAFGTILWVKNKNNVNTVFHEINHALRTIQESMRFEDEEEFNSYIAGFVNEKVFEWLIS